MPAGSTYSTIATTTLGSAQASYTFTGISSAFTDIILVATISNVSSSADSILLQVGNGTIDTANNYSRTRLLWNGSSATSANRTSAPNIDFDSSPPSSSSAFSVTTIHFQNYSNTTTNKTVLIRNSNASDFSVATVGLWRSTSAINQIRINGNAANLAANSTFTLYGILSA